MTYTNPAPAVVSIEEKVRLAEELFSANGPALKEDPRILELIEDLARKIEASQKAMIDFGIVGACRHCDEEEGGSCCGAGIENRYGHVLLLANLLMGASLSHERLVPNGCFFLGKYGCSLKVRHVLCVNFLCTKIENMLSLEDLIKLQHTTGDELDTVFVLHETIKKCINK